MTSPRPDSRLGTDLGPYRIERVLGRGGMGVVYLAEQRELGRMVALKLLPDELAHDADFRARFLRESKLAASIDHANIIPIYEAGEAAGTYYLAMRYVEGTDLDERLKAGPLDPGLTTDLLAQVAGALDAAHAAGLVHRDVKPANLLLADEGGAVPHVYLTDFGLTKRRASQTGGLTRAGSTLGTLEYMAPEQVEGGEVDAPADAYALACVAFQCLTGRVPFERDSDVAVAMAHLRDAPPSAVALRPELPAGVDAVLARGMAKDPFVRYETCAALIADLRHALSGALIATPTTPLTPTPRRRPLAIAGVLGLGLVAIAGLALASGLGGAGSGSPSSPTGSVPVAVAASSASAASEEHADALTPDPSIFPNGPEQTLLAMLPPDLRATCERGGGQADAIEAGFTGRVIETYRGSARTPVYGPLYAQTPSSSVACRPADRVAPIYFQWFSESTPEGEAVADALIGKIAGKLNLSDGDCATSPPALARWSSTSASGRVACAPDPTGKVWLYWTFAGGRALGFAAADEDAYPALYGWFDRLASFLP